MKLKSTLIVLSLIAAPLLRRTKRSARRANKCWLNWRRLSKTARCLPLATRG